MALFHSEQHEAWLLAPFGGLVTPEMLRAIRRLVPKVSPYTYPLAEFAPGWLPFEAYEVPPMTVKAPLPEKEIAHA